MDMVNGLVKSLNDKKLVSVNLSGGWKYNMITTQVWSSKSDYEDIVKSTFFMRH